MEGNGKKDTRPLLVLNPRGPGVYGLNALLGALEQEQLHEKLDVRFAPGPVELAGALAEWRPAVVAWSFFSFAFPAVREEMAALARRSDVLHIAGGPHASAEPGETLRAGFDYIAMGEGERLFVALIRRWLAGESPWGIPGLWRLEEGRVRSAGMAERGELDDFPPFAASYRRFNPVEITRGCIYACKYCQTPYLFKARFRHRSLENIRRHAQTIKGRAMRDIRFITPTALSYGSHDTSANLEAVEALLVTVREVMGAEGRIFYGSFPSEVRPEHVTPQALALLKRHVHNDNVVIGAQSGSARVLEHIKRGHGVEVIEAATRHALEAGFITYVDFIFGLPGEGPDEIEESLQLAERLAAMGARIHGHSFMPLPGTPFRNEPAGVLESEIHQRISRMTTRGILFGQWQPQAKLASELATKARGRLASPGPPDASRPPLWPSGRR